jgi:hypothetical protein
MGQINMSVGNRVESVVFAVALELAEFYYPNFWFINSWYENDGLFMDTVMIILRF